MAETGYERLLGILTGPEKEYELLLGKAGKEEADAAADVILAVNSGELKSNEKLLQRLLGLASACKSGKLRTVAIGTLWREDLKWLSTRVEGEETAREKMLEIVAADEPKALAPVFWRAVAEQGPRFALIAFKAAMSTHPHEAARLLVTICRAALAGQLELSIRDAVDAFLASQDSSVRTTFLATVKRMPEAEKRKLITHLDMSLMAELDKSAIEHRGSDFFYDEDAERRKRDDKSKDIFDEVRRRLERGEKPQL
ncbi:MAG TPA: hypothetical protein VMX35_07940 [Acidobacteriota bacterium]|nr:hypothetical protein [Acidobacteriota bacterium]